MPNQQSSQVISIVVPKPLNQAVIYGGVCAGAKGDGQHRKLWKGSKTYRFLAQRTTIATQEVDTASLCAFSPVHPAQIYRSFVLSRLNGMSLNRSRLTTVWHLFVERSCNKREDFGRGTLRICWKTIMLISAQWKPLLKCEIGEEKRARILYFLMMASHNRFLPVWCMPTRRLNHRLSIITVLLIWSAMYARELIISTPSASNGIRNQF